MFDDLPPVDGHVTIRIEQPRLQVRQKLMEALARERIILELWGPLVPNEFDFGATTRDLWELWCAEVGELRAPPPRPTPRNYQETADALDLFQRAVDALPDSTPPTPPLAPRLTLDRDTLTVTLDGESYTLEDPTTFLLYAAVVEAEQPPITADTIRGKVKGLNGSKAVVKRIASLPDSLRQIIKSAPGRGYWFQLPPLS